MFCHYQSPYFTIFIPFLTCCSFCDKKLFILISDDIVFSSRVLFFNSSVSFALFWFLIWKCLDWFLCFWKDESLRDFGFVVLTFVYRKKDSDKGTENGRFDWRVSTFSLLRLQLVLLQWRTLRWFVKTLEMSPTYKINISWLNMQNYCLSIEWKWMKMATFNFKMFTCFRLPTSLSMTCGGALKAVLFSSFLDFLNLLSVFLLVWSVK